MTPPKILFIGGNHPRHLYYANQIHIRYPLAGAVIQDRGSLLSNLTTTPISVSSRRDDLLWTQHFGNRAGKEAMYFGKQEAPFLDGFNIRNQDELNNKYVLSFVKNLNPDIALIFGCGMIRGELAQVLPELTINLHLGLSPRYRGAATLFWPFYFLEPQWAGCTFHKITDEPDAGDILHQCVPELARGDGIHDVAAKAVVKATDDMIKLLKAYHIAFSSIPKFGWDFHWHKQSTTGKNFLARDFQPSHLRMIYETYNNDIVDQYLDGNLKQHLPKLVR